MISSRSPLSTSSNLYNVRFILWSVTLPCGKLQIGSGDRSERIRTYNFPQGRVTDHRINLTLYKLEEVLNGDLEEIINGLTSAERLEAMTAFETDYEK